MFNSFKKILDDNWEISLKENSTELSKVIFHIEIIEELEKSINSEPQIMIREVIYDIETAIVASLNSLYRNAYISMRSSVELILAYIYFVDHNYDYLFWKNDKYDIKWSVLRDKEKGILNQEYLSLFGNDNFELLIDSFIEVYHECSQSVHGKYEYMFSVRCGKIKYNKEACLCYLKLNYKVTSLIIALLIIRYSDKILNINEIYRTEIEDILKKYKLLGFTKKIKECWG